MNMITNKTSIAVGRKQEPIRQATAGVYHLYKSKPTARAGSMDINGSIVRGFVYEQSGERLFYTILNEEMGASCYEVTDTFKPDEAAS